MRERAAESFAAFAARLGRGVRADAAAAGEAAWPRWAIALVLLIAAVDVAWLSLTSLSLSPRGMAPAVNGIICALALLIVSRMLGLSGRIRMLLNGLLFILLAWPVLRVFNHLAMTTAFPLADPFLSAADGALGLDWLAYVRWADASPALLQLMDWAYSSLTGYSCLAFVLLLFLVGVERAREFVLLFLLTAVAATTIGMFFPAEAAMTFYAPDPALFRSIDGQTGAYHLDMLARLRTDPDHVLVLSALPGLTTFPSFHTAMGVVVVYCARGSRPLFVPMLVLNGLMIASTPVYGSHYFVDIVAGFLLTGAAILLLRRLTPRPGARDAAGAEA